MSSHTSDSRKRAAHSSPQGSVARRRGGASGASVGSVGSVAVHSLPTVGENVPLTNLNFQHSGSSYISHLSALGSVTAGSVTAGSVTAGSVTAVVEQSTDHDTKSVLSTFEDPIDELVTKFLPKAKPIRRSGSCIIQGTVRCRARV
jgi:hypothetical protein